MRRLGHEFVFGPTVARYPTNQSIPDILAPEIREIPPIQHLANNCVYKRHGERKQSYAIISSSDVLSMAKVSRHSSHKSCNSCTYFPCNSSTYASSSSSLFRC